LGTTRYPYYQEDTQIIFKIVFSPPKQEEGITRFTNCMYLHLKKREEGDTACGLAIKKWFARPHAVSLPLAFQGNPQRWVQNSVFVSTLLRRDNIREKRS